MENDGFVAFQSVFFIFTQIQRIPRLPRGKQNGERGGLAYGFDHCATSPQNAERGALNSEHCSGPPTCLWQCEKKLKCRKAVALLIAPAPLTEKNLPSEGL